MYPEPGTHRTALQTIPGDIRNPDGVQPVNKKGAVIVSAQYLPVILQQLPDLPLGPGYDPKSGEAVRSVNIFYVRSKKSVVCPQKR